MSEEGKRKRAWLSDVAADFAVFTVFFCLLTLPLPLITGDPWWTGLLLGPLLAATFLAVRSFRNALTSVAQRREQARRSGASLRDESVWGRIVGWCADRRELVFIAVAVLLVVGYGWAEAGWGWALIMLGSGAVLQVAWRTARYFRRSS
jgi:uncharacterized membrane protein YdfJ with MMPL/SSD domain